MKLLLQIQYLWGEEEPPGKSLSISLVPQALPQVEPSRDNFAGKSQIQALFVSLKPFSVLHSSFFMHLCYRGEDIKSFSHGVHVELFFSEY